MLYHTTLYYTILTILYYTLLGIKGHVMPVGSQCSKVKLSSKTKIKPQL